MIRIQKKNVLYDKIGISKILSRAYLESHPNFKSLYIGKPEIEIYTKTKEEKPDK